MAVKHVTDTTGPFGVSMGEREMLVILDTSTAGRVAPEIDRRVRVVHRMPPRVLVIRGADDELGEVAAIPGVARALERGAAGHGLDELSDGERLFVRGWLARSAPEQRPGEGLDWDAEGFTPPD